MLVLRAKGAKVLNISGISQCTPAHAQHCKEITGFFKNQYQAVTDYIFFIKLCTIRQAMLRFLKTNHPIT